MNKIDDIGQNEGVTQCQGSTTEKKTQLSEISKSIGQSSSTESKQLKVNASQLSNTNKVSEFSKPVFNITTQSYYRLSSTSSKNITLISNRDQVIETTLAELGLEKENVGIYPTQQKHKTGQVYSSIDPTTNKEIAKIYFADWEQIDRALDVMVRAQKKWASLPASFRVKLILEMNEVFKKKQEAYSRMLAIEVGKTLDEARGEEVEVHHTAELIEKYVHLLGGDENTNFIFYPSGEKERREQGCKRFQVLKPLGNLQKTTAFNFPRAVFLWGAFPALAVGNGVNLKPHPGAALISLATVKNMNEILRPHELEGLVNITITDQKNGRRLWMDERFKMIEATGSEQMGKECLKAVTERTHDPFIRCNLELGGNNASAIRNDANIDIAANLLVFSCFGLQGQRCTTTRRIFVHKDIFDEFIEKFATACKKDIRIGDPLSPDVNFGPLFDKKAVDIYKKTIADIKKTESEIIVGGHHIKDNFVEPTIVKVNTTKFPFSYHEYFVPIVFVMPFEKDEEAIAEINQPGYGLSGSVFTKDEKAFIVYANSIRATVFNQNYGTSGAEVVGIFGGWDRTGNGQMLGTIPEGKLFDHYAGVTGGLIAPSNTQAKHAQGVGFTKNIESKSMELISGQ